MESVLSNLETLSAIFLFTSCENVYIIYIVFHGHAFDADVT